MCSCTSNISRIEREVKEMINRRIEFTGNYIIIPSKDSVKIKNMLSDEAKIVTYIDKYQSCNECTFNALKQWCKVLNKLNTQRFSYIIVFYTEEVDEIRRIIEHENFSVPVICYKTDEFGKKNKISDKLTKNRTFLLNQYNEIVLIGEPFNNKKLFELYNTTILSLVNGEK